MKFCEKLVPELTAFLFAVPFSFAGLLIENLKCEYLPGIVATDVKTPRLSWAVRTDDWVPRVVSRGQKQTAYRVFVTSSEAGLRKEKGDLWDSGRVDSEQNVHVRYQGRPLESRQQCFWKVQVWDKDDKKSEWSTQGTFEMGLLEQKDWEPAAWIGLADDTRQSPFSRREVKTVAMVRPEEYESFPSPLFRKEFETRSRILRARTYICGLGYYELYVNGKRIGEQVLDPGQTTYDVRAFYAVHDVTKWLNPGRNAIGIWLGNGFYGQNIAFAAKELAWGPPVVICRTVIDYTDGGSEAIVTDESWKANASPVVFDNVYAGETYDARRERAGWNVPGYDDFQWQKAARVAGPTSKLVVQNLQPIRRMLPVYPRQVLEGKGGKWIFDLEQNISGWVKIRVNESPGTKITLRFSESLTEDGRELDVASTGTNETGIEHVCIYICKGNGWEVWEPRFTYHSFRYVEVDGVERRPPPDMMEGVPVRSAVEPRGNFSCSDESLNRIYGDSLRTLERNMHGVPEDSARREKCAGLGEAGNVAESSIFNFDMPQFWAKFMDDIETVMGRGEETYEKQKATPGIPCNIGVGRRLNQEARPDWGASMVLVPWYLYLYYGDTEVSARHYESMKRFVEHVGKLARDGIVYQGYGDVGLSGETNRIEAPVELTSTAYHYRTLVIMDRIAGFLGKPDDAGKFWAEAQKTKLAFNKKFLDKSVMSYGGQTANAVALRFGLAPEGREGDIAGALRASVADKEQGRVQAGSQGLRPLYSMLCDYGYDEAAYVAISKQDFPARAGQSGVAAWFHESLGGIKPMDDVTGFRRIDLEPHCYAQLARVDASYMSMYGLVVSSWTNAPGRFEWKVVIPPNVTAVVHVPASSAEAVEENGVEAGRSPGVKFLRYEKGRAVYDVVSGSYFFKSKL